MKHFTVNVQIASPYVGRVSAATVRAAARAALEHAGAPAPGELTIIIAGDARLRRLNRLYLNRDRPTDVLAFPQDGSDPDTGRRYFGDIAISYPRACIQARAAGHSPAAELRLLVVHGVLHLLGYDHATPRDQARMWAIQAAILNGMLSRKTARQRPHS